MRTKQWITGIFAGIIFTGCGQLNTNMKEFSMPETTEAKIEEEAKNSIERMAAEKHVKPELSDEFISQYLDMNSFEELKQRTKEGIHATQDMAKMTEQEFQLWKDIIDTEMLNQYTTDDLEGKKSELKNILESMAKAKNMELEEMMKESYHMNQEELDSFLEKQAAKFFTPDEKENMDSDTKNNEAKANE